MSERIRLQRIRATADQPKGHRTPPAAGARGPHTPVPSRVGHRLQELAIASETQREPSSQDLARRVELASLSGRPLEDSVRGDLEGSLHTDLSQVRMHDDHQADELARSMNARAFTSGRDVFFMEGAFDPDSEDGFRLIAHEVFHTLQQAAGPVEGTPAPGGVTISDPSDRSERAAEQAAAAVVEGSPCPAISPASTGTDGPAVQRDTLDDIAKYLGLGGGAVTAGLSSAGGAAAAAAPWVSGPIAAGLLGAYGGKALEEHTSVGTHAQETLGGFDAMMTDPGERSWMLRQSESASENWDKGNYGSAIASGAKLAGGGLIGALGGIGGGLVDAGSWVKDLF